MYRNFTHSISPKKVIRGEEAWNESKYIIPSICKRPLLVGRSRVTYRQRSAIARDIKNLNIDCYLSELKYDCCEEDLRELYNISKYNSCDGIIAAGGGKVLDAGKLLADRLEIPCITIPLSASTCAGWTALSNIYSPEGAFIRDIALQSCPDLLIFDYKFVREAPIKTLASGISDALAKWYEASLSSSSSNDGLAQQAVQMARVLRDQLFIDGLNAIENTNSEAWIRVAEGCALTAGVIGGIGGSKCRTAVAHPIHNGLTQLNFTQKPLHGEIVGVGTLIQLHLEEIHSSSLLATQARKQLIEFYKKLSLPTKIESLGLEKLTAKDLKKVCKFTCDNSVEVNNLPFKVNKEILFEAIISLKDAKSKVNIKNTTQNA